MEHVKQHFEEEAQAFDTIIRCLIPFYEQMLDALVLALPFDPSQAIRVIDLGCGTGEVAGRIKKIFPHSQITCVDLAENMLRAARARLGENDRMRYQRSSFEHYSFDSTYDVAVSSLALHHLASDSEKYEFYKKIYAALNPGGIFFTADNILGSNSHLQELYMKKWCDYMRLRIPQEEIEHTWIPKHYDEDHPALLADQLRWLHEIGYVQVDVLWKYYNFAVYGGCKPAT